MQKATIYIAALYMIIACAKDEDKSESNLMPDCYNNGALSTCLSPKFDSSYYIEQGIKYFQTMESDIPIDVQPNYAPKVIRWEWPPWLLLTGYGKDFLIQSDILLKLNPTQYYTLECKYFEEQPFCRCHVVFDYSGDSCPIYEEFTFNDFGEITFIEAWSDYESTLPPGMNAGNDSSWTTDEYWAMQSGINRLSIKVPGLGTASGDLLINSPYMKIAIANDIDVAEMARRIKNPVRTYLQQLVLHSTELKHGCEAPVGDIYPYFYP